MLHIICFSADITLQGIPTSLHIRKRRVGLSINYPPVLWSEGRRGIMSSVPVAMRLSPGVLHKVLCSNTALCVLLISLLPTLSSASLYYPPFFNVALMKPVTVEPSNSICGSSSPTEYCESMVSRQSVLSCGQETCDMRCPYRSSLPTSDRVRAFQRLQTGYTWGDCVKLDSSMQAPLVGSAESKNFLGTSASGSDPCYIDLDPNWMVQVILMGSQWTATLEVWLYHRHQDNTATIIDFASSGGEAVIRVFVDNGIIKIQDSQSERFSDSWQLPDSQWTHVGLQVYDQSASLFLNGSFVGPALYNLQLSQPAKIGKFRVGNTQAEDQPFVGYMEELLIFTSTLTNREMMEMFDGSFPAVRMQSECRCPSSHPALKQTNNLYCVQNPGDGRLLTEEYRIRRGQSEAYPLEMVNDGVIDSKWVGQPGLESSVITIDLEQVYEVRHVEVSLYSPYPGVMIIERQQNTSSDWQEWQFFSQNCLKETGFQPEGMLTFESDTICKYFYSPNLSKDEVKYSGGVVTLDLLQGRPGQLQGGIFTPELREFLQAKAIRITMRGHPEVLDDKHKYHGLYDIKVNATCDCHGHGSSCNMSVEPYECECAADTFTRGRQCEQCLEGTFREEGLDDYSPGLCSQCACQTNGTVGGVEQCKPTGGQCTCKQYATGRQCDTCQPGYHNLMAENHDGCQLCTCNVTGTINGSNVCDVTTSQCPCKENVEGLACDRCMAGYYTEDFAAADGCNACSCDAAGTQPGGDVDCNVKTGQCVCKEHVSGRMCDSCLDGYYNLSASNSGGCESCDCDLTGSLNTSCDPITGQCLCRPNVEGQRCDTCKPGYYALDDDELIMNGCTHKCNCSTKGTIVDQLDCEDLGGQCPCRENVEGRQCDRCKINTYGLGVVSDNRSATQGCVACDCNAAGTVNSSLTCDLVTGQCQCKVNVRGRQCDACVSGAYGLSAANQEGCTDCGCSVHGTVPGSECDVISGQCQCRPGQGQVAIGGKQCLPYIEGFHPTYGPESGGTRVVISSGYLGKMDNISAHFANVDCPIRYGQATPTSFVCFTKSLRDVGMSSLLKTDLNLSLALSDGEKVSPNTGNFVYKEDPEIYTIHPLRSFLSGGIILTVTGDHLDSVAYPKFEVHMVYSRQDNSVYRDMFETNCTVINGTVMTCPTPNITLHDDFLEPNTPSRRRRRNILQDERLNSDDLEFYIGFHLDGVTRYRNMSAEDASMGVLIVYRNPEFYMFEEKDNIKVYRTYWPYYDDHIVIKGKRMNYGATVEDYTVAIGKNVCSELDLVENRLACIPPANQPEPTEVLGRNGIPEVVIKVGNIVFFLGHLHYETSIWDNLQFRYGIIGGLCALVLLILLAVLICCLCKRRRQKRREREQKAKKILDHPFDEWTMDTSRTKGNPYTSSFDPKASIHSSGYLRPDNSLMKPDSSLMKPERPDLIDLLPRDLRTTIKHSLIDEKLLVLGKLIGEGHFGRVYIGQLSDGKHPYKETVAVKTLREYNVSMKEVTQFLEEVTLMSNFHHDHVLGLTAVAVKDNHPFVVLPYMENGDLKSFISNDENMLTVGELIHFAMQISDGMHYLSEQHFVHRDLACRNCMINKDMLVKVADFGLSRDIYTSDYYKVNNTKRPLPVKWMAVESLETGKFDTKSDVWSFGVVLWELLTRGCQPYPDVDNFDMKTFIMCGNRMDRPDYAPDEMYLLMLECWAEDPQKRPNFRKIYNRIAIFLDESSTKTVMRDHQSQQVPSIAYRGRSYIDISSGDKVNFDYNMGN